MSSKRTSRSKKPEASLKIRDLKKETNGTDDDTGHEDIEINLEESDGEESSASDKPKKRAGDSSLNKVNWSMPEDIRRLIEKITCCSCGKQLNPMNHGAVRRHPWLKVVTCKKCYKFLRSGPFTRDNDGIDEQCRWCGDGGRLYGCDYCHNCFCRSCIKRNMGRSEAAMMENEDDSKWHCYICKPKKIRKLVEDCEKIINYVASEEKKEREREERAKQREKEKSEKLKEKSKKEVNGNAESKEKKDDKERKEEKSTPKRSLPAPKDKSLLAEKLTEKKAPDTSKLGMNVSQSAPDLIVVEDSPSESDKPLHHRAVNYKPDVKTGVQHVQRISNNITAVTVGPKNDKPVINPLLKNFPQPRQPLTLRPLLAGMLKTPLSSAPYNVDRGLLNLKKMPPLNDIKALKNNVFPYNVEGLVDKMGTATQALSLSLNSIKTDLAIAKLSQSNMYQAKQTGASQLKNGLEIFFNQVRELLNVQLIANYPQLNPPDKSQGDSTPLSSSSLTSTPKGKSEPLVNSLSENLEESIIPIEIEDSSPVKKVAKKEKMETDDVVIMTDSESKDDVVIITNSESNEIKKLHIKENRVDKEEIVSSEKENCEGKNKEEDDAQKSCDAINIDDDDDDDEENEKDKERNSISVDNKTVHNENEKTELSRSKSETYKKEENDENDKSEDSNITCETDSSKKEKDKSKKLEEEKDDNKNDLQENDADNKVDESENTAAELELLKEMADELNDQEEKSMDTTEPRRSSRNKKSETLESKSESDTDSPVRRSSRQRQKPETSSKEKTDDKQDKTSEKRKKRVSDDKKSENSKEDSDDDEIKESVKKEKKTSSDKEKKTLNEKEKKTSGEKERKTVSEKEKKSLKKSGGGSKIDYDVKSDDETVEKKVRKKEKESADSRSRSKKKDESTNDETEEEVKDEKSKKVDSKKKTRKEAAANKVSDSDETETDVKETKAKKEDIKKKGSKKVDENKVDMDAEDDVPMDESDTTESSDESVQEFGKRKKKRTAVVKEETSRRQTRQKAKKSESNTENSDTDSDFDPELEREIKSLSKNTRLTRKKAKEAQESKTEKKNNKEKPKEKEEKKGKKNTKEEDIDDLSSDIEEVSEVEENDSEEDTDNLSASQLKKLKQAGKAVMEDESDDEDRPEGFSDDSSDDPEVSFPKIVSAEKGKKHSVDDSDDSDFISPKKKKKRIKDKLLDAKISDSESDTGKKGKKGKKKGGKKRKQKDSDEFSELSDEEENRKRGSPGKKRRRIRKIASSEEEGEKEPGAEDKIDDDDDDGTQGGFLKRKHIRRVIGSKKLTDETKAAQKAEEERRKRIEERQKEYNTYVEVEGGESEEDELPEGTEREITTPVKTVSIAKILGSPRKIPITTKCVLEMDKEKKKPLIEVDRTLIKKLKPHQVEAVRFMYNCCIESIERLKKEEGAGCILAHCMGLGKTLSVITFIHTMLSNVKLTKMTKCLVVCPLNTCLNWVNEFEIWLQDVDFEIEVYEMSRVKQNFERAQMLKEWHEGGAAVLIMGYDMYRNLVMGSHCKNKKQKKIFYETLANPGPDLVVCDEGHILKNDATSLSKAMSNIVTHRRIVLTGTPLQNNLGEYHCMVSFVKPSLLGTRREFNNRFCNPISNGQCSDSTAFDVKLMKRRAHILHELLAGCVQRKDYSALTKFLPPKFEYVISVRLSPVQMTLYEKYLEVNNMSGDVRSKGSRLFADYQALMRIWTHPWVLKLDEIRQENKRMYDDEDEDSFIDDSDSEMDSFIDDSTTSPSNSSDDGDESAGSNKKKKKKRKTRRNKGSSSSGDESKKENPDEVVKKWTSKRRGNEEGAGSSWMMDTSYNQGPKEVTSEWWAEFVKEEDEFKLELSGKLVLMFEILKMCEDIGDKVLIFSQSLLSLDIIEDFLAKIDEANNPTNETSSTNKPSDNTAGKSDNSAGKSDNTAGKSDNTAGKSDKEEGEKTEKTQDEKNKERLSQYGKSWSKGLDYFRMDGSTNSQNRKSSQDQFNDPENYRARLFLISTKAGSLGINLVSANRVIIFDASWNPSHDIQSIFRVYRFGQVKPVYVYRFLAQGTMEEKIYERQVTKQSLSQRVVDEHQIERHFTSSDLQELYTFQPDRLDNSENADKPLPILPKDHMLAELMTNNKEWIVKYHEHDSLLENVVEQELTEDEKKAAWEDYENEKKGINSAMGGMQMNPAMLATQHMNMQNLLMQGQANLGQAAVLQIVQDLKARFPNLPPEVFQQRVQAVLKQVLTQQIMQQSEMQRRQIEHQRMNELSRLNQIKQEIQRQQAMINNQQRAYSMSGLQPGMSTTGLQSLMTQGLRPQTLSQLPVRPSMNFNNDQQKK